jgi:hypothetical protein
MDSTQIGGVSGLRSVAASLYAVLHPEKPASRKVNLHIIVWNFLGSEIYIWGLGLGIGTPQLGISFKPGFCCAAEATRILMKATGSYGTFRREV